MYGIPLLFAHSAFDGHLGCLSCLAVMDQAAVNTRLWVVRTQKNENTDARQFYCETL